MLTETDRSRCGELADKLLTGTDGFLAMPYTIEAVQETVMLALQIRLQRLTKRVEVASRIVLDKLRDDLDALAFDAAYRGKPACISQRLRDSMATFRAMDETERDIFFSVAAEIFGAARPFCDLVYVEEMRRLRSARSEDPALDACADALLDGDWRKRADAADAVPLLGENGALLVGFLKQMLSDPFRVCRARALHALAQIDGEIASAAIEEHLSHIEPRWRGARHRVDRSD